MEHQYPQKCIDGIWRPKEEAIAIFFDSNTVFRDKKEETPKPPKDKYE